METKNFKGSHFLHNSIHHLYAQTSSVWQTMWAGMRATAKTLISAEQQLWNNARGRNKKRCAEAHILNSHPRDEQKSSTEQSWFLTKGQIKLHRKLYYTAVFLQEGYVVSSCTIISGVFNTIHFFKYIQIYIFFYLRLDGKIRSKEFKRKWETYSNCTADTVSGDHNHWNPSAALLHPWSTVCLLRWLVQFHSWKQFCCSASRMYSHREHSESLMFYHHIYWNYVLYLRRKNKRLFIDKDNQFLRYRLKVKENPLEP